MVKTQVQIPDELFKRTKQLAAEKEWSFAEVVRLGLEYMTRVNPLNRVPGEVWRLPAPRDLGLFLLPEEQWTAASHED